jgi:protein-S-isoprenylcysteine O-methyltransferase Ste14
MSRHEHGHDLAGEHRLTDIGQIAGLFVFLPVWIVDSFVLHWTTIPASFVPPYIRIPIAAALLILSSIMAYTSHSIIFKEVRNPASVIDTGSFRFIRHPLYLSELILYAGFFLMSLSLASLAVIAAIFFFLNYVASAEERICEATFGEAYREYMARTGKWVPRIFAGNRLKVNHEPLRKT